MTEKPRVDDRYIHKYIKHYVLIIRNTYIYIMRNSANEDEAHEIYVLLFSTTKWPQTERKQCVINGW